MLTPLMIISLDQGKPAHVPRSIGKLDERLLEDIKDCLPGAVEQSGMFPQILKRAVMLLLPKRQKRRAWYGGLMTMDAMHQ